MRHLRGDITWNNNIREGITLVCHNSHFNPFSSAAQSCPTLCDPMECSMPGFPVHHQLPKLTQTYVHRVSDAIQPSHLCCSLFLLPSIFPSIRVFSNESVLLISWSKYSSFRFSISPSNEYSGLISFRINPFYCFPLILYIVHLRRLSCLSLLFSETMFN